MSRIDLGVPEPIVDALPSDGGDAAADMRRAVAGWEDRIDRALEDAADDRAAAAVLTDAVERMEERRDGYDAFVPELRAWGQSPIYAIAWRNLYADLIGQVYEHDDVGGEIDRERNARVVEDGIRWRDVD